MIWEGIQESVDPVIAAVATILVFITLLVTAAAVARIYATAKPQASS